MTPEIKTYLLSLKDIPSFNRPVRDINERGASNEAPLHIASIQGNLPIVRALIEAGAEVNALGEHSYTPLHEAIEQGHQQVAFFLIKNGASLNIPNSDGITALEMLSQVGWTINDNERAEPPK